MNRDYFTNLYLEASSLKIEGQGEKGQNIIWLTFLYWALGEVGPPNIGCCPDQYRGTIGWGGGITFLQLDKHSVDIWHGQQLP